MLDTGPAVLYSNNMSYSFETVQQVWDDKSGERIEIGPDRDALELIEIRHVSNEGKTGQSVVMTKEQAELVYKALGKLLDK